MIIQNSKLKANNHSLKVKTDLRQRSYDYSVNIIKFLGSLPKDQIYGILADQLLRSATSIGANITEAKASSSKKDFQKFYEIALKSANETLYWLGLLRDALNINNSTISGLINETNELCHILGASVLTIKGKNRI